MKISIILICLVVFVVTSPAFDIPQKYSHIKVLVPDKATLDNIWATGIDFEGSSGKIGGWMEFIVAPFELHELSQRNINFEIIHDDASEAATRQLSTTPMNALGFGYGSMGGYYTYAEVALQLDSMKLQYPSLITTKEAIGYGNEGRELWAVKISDNPSSDEDEPEALYTALHHAREPAGMMTVVYYMWWLLENYGNDPTATYLVNNREMWFIPVVNPDGYSYNQTTNPTGGGFWRKNRRDNGGGAFGVDPNRNYGTFDMWNAPNGGSSTSPTSDTYRGTAPFSEPENAGIDGFMRSHNIKTCLNYHTYSRLLIYPWGYLSGESGDSVIFREFAFDMTGTNRYATGTDLQTVAYSTRGNSDDYMYGDVSKPQTYAMTPEVGTSFWPPSNQILPLALENLDANKYYSYVAGQYSATKHFSVSDNESDGDIETGESFFLNTLIYNKGLGDAPELHIDLSASSPDIQFSVSSNIIGNLISRSETTVTFSGSVAPTALAGTKVLVYVDITDTSGYAHRDTLPLYIGAQTIILSDDAESGTGNWSTGASWGTTSNAHSGSFSFADSPVGNYAASASNSLQILSPLDLNDFAHVTFSFWAKWSIEPAWDFGLVEISTNGGANWTTLRSSLSHTGSTRGVQAAGTWGYDAYTPGLDWAFQEIDLSSYSNNQVLIRFRLNADGGDQRDGLYVDDIHVIGYRAIAQSSSLLITDGGSGTGSLDFGEATIATDGVDSLLGEYELAPKPAQGTFDLRWTIPSTDGTNKDIREPLSVSNPSNTFIAEFQPGPGGYPITFQWNAETFLPGGWYLRDGLTSGSIFNINMWMDTSIIISDTSVHSIEIVHTQTDTVSFNVQDKWNLVSLPMVVEDPAVSTLFPGAASNAFSFESNSYSESESLEVKKGYWLKMNGASVIQMTGVPIVQDTIIIPNGWTLVAASSFCPQQASAVCPACNFYQYFNGYQPASTLTPGMAVWVKGPVTLIHSCFGNDNIEPKRSLSPGIESLRKLSISDADGGNSTLYFGENELTHHSIDAYELPPLPPFGLFDARFSSQRFVESFLSQQSTTAEKEINIQSSHYPVTVEWDAKRNDGSSYEIQSIMGGKPVATQSVVGQSRMTITDSRITTLRLRKITGGSVPASFALLQNYPNPFNPATTIQFDVPEQSIITIKVFNTLGELVATVEDKKEFAAGTYSSVFDASTLSSGVYYYTLTAATARGKTSAQFTHKMIVLK